MNTRLLYQRVLGIVVLAIVCFSSVNIRSLETTVYAATIGGTGSLSGTVQAPKPFKAARVYAKNVDKDVRYMVYTAGGRYRAVDLFPGNYEVSVQKRGFAGDVKKLVVRAGANATADFSLREATANPNQATIVPYDTLYPSGEGRNLAEKTCIVCHGAGFLPSHQWSETEWNAALDLMTSPQRSLILPNMLSPKERPVLVAYLTKNFGPNNPKRQLDIGGEIPIDEQALAKAMYVEYYLPLDAKPEGARPRGLHDPHFDRDGNVWYTDRGANQIGKLDPRTGMFKDYQVATPKAYPHGITTDATGHIWWAGDIAVGQLDPKSGEMMLYRIDPTSEITYHGHTPIVDSKQNVWFSNILENKLGKWDRQTEKITLWESPTYASWPYGVVADKVDKIWFAEWRRCKLTRFDPDIEQFTEYSPIKRPCSLKRLGIDSKGLIWYGTAVLKGGKLGKLDPNTGKMLEYDIPMPYWVPYDVQPDREDNIWMGDDQPLNEQATPAQNKFDTALVKFDPRTEKFIFYQSPQRNIIPKIEITRDGAIWYTPAAEIPVVGVLYPDMDKINTLAAYY